MQDASACLAGLYNLAEMLQSPTAKAQGSLRALPAQAQQQEPVWPRTKRLWDALFDLPESLQQLPGPGGLQSCHRGQDSQVVVIRFNNSDNRGVGVFFFPPPETFQFIELFN